MGDIFEHHSWNSWVWSCLHVIVEHDFLYKYDLLIENLITKAYNLQLPVPSCSHLSPYSQVVLHLQYDFTDHKEKIDCAIHDVDKVNEGCYMKLPGD